MMNKREIIELHILALSIKQYLEENNFGCDFSGYNELGIYPYQQLRTKKEHKQAIFLLAEEFGNLWKRKEMGIHSESSHKQSLL